MALGLVYRITGEMRTLLFSRLIFKMHLTLCLEMLFFMIMQYTFQACSLGPPDVTVLILFSSIHWVVLLQNQEYSKGTPWVPCFFALVLHRIVQSNCLNVLYQAWWWCIGRQEIICALVLVQEIGQSLARIHVNIAKNELRIMYRYQTCNFLTS